MKNTTTLAASALFALSAPVAIQAQTANQTTASDNSDSVVLVEGVLKITQSAMGQTQESEQNVSSSAIVVNENGTLVTALTQLNPSDTIDGRTVNTQQGPITLSVSGELSDLRIILADGTEVDARAVISDSQSNLIVIKPDAEDAEGIEWNNVELNSEHSEPSQLDDLLLLGRLSNDYDRASTATESYLSAIIERPRTMYVPAGGSQLRDGQAAFNQDGHFIGITTTYLAPGVEIDGNSEASVTIIQPISEIERLLNQAQEDDSE